MTAMGDRSLSPATTCPQDITSTPRRLQESLQLSRTPDLLAQPRRYRPVTGHEVSVCQSLREPGLTVTDQNSRRHDSSSDLQNISRP